MDSYWQLKNSFNQSYWYLVVTDVLRRLICMREWLRRDCWRMGDMLLRERGMRQRVIEGITMRGFLLRCVLCSPSSPSFPSPSLSSFERAASSPPPLIFFPLLTPPILHADPSRTTRQLFPSLHSLLFRPTLRPLRHHRRVGHSPNRLHYRRCQTDFRREEQGKTSFVLC